MSNGVVPCVAEPAGPGGDNRAVRPDLRLARGVSREVVLSRGFVTALREKTLYLVMAVGRRRDVAQNL